MPTGDGPDSFNATFEGKVYSLEVVQQPIRARMCGFGDKDRRPITPPPCIRLIIKRAGTGEEINISEVDTSFYVLTVDLWDASGKEEQNLVKNPGGSPNPAISASIPLAYPHTVHNSDMTSSQHPSSSYFSSSTNSYSSASSDPRYAQPAPPSAYSNPSPYGPSSSTSGYGPPSTNGYVYHSAYQPPSPYTQQSPMTSAGGYASGIPPHMHSRDYVTSASTATSSSSNPPVYNRNLIGSLSASAFVLTDDKGQEGIWFVMQDLSVRQEGIFRLKMSFVDVGNASRRGADGSVPISSQTLDGRSSNGLRTTAPVLASCFSKPFQVFSAKKFPGVIESTELSKTFANQGIKIPIRQGDQSNKRNRDSDSEDE